MTARFPLDRLVAHRGASAERPENTLPAVEAALAAGAAAVEVDVQISADGVPYVIHDPVLMRTAGCHGQVGLMNAARLDGISVHEPARFAGRYQPTPLPRLSALVDCLNAWPGCLAFIELKRHSLRRCGVVPALSRVREVMRPARFDWVLISFDAAVIEAARGQPRGWVLPAWDEDHRTTAGKLAPDYLFVNVERIADAAFWPGPWRWTVYEVGDWPGVRHWLDRGADLVETNSILQLSAVARNAGSSSPAP